LSQQNITLLISIISAATSVFAVLIAFFSLWLNYRRDVPKVQVCASVGLPMRNEHGQVIATAVSNEGGLLLQNGNKITLSVTNLSMFPVTIQKIGLDKTNGSDDYNLYLPFMAASESWPVVIGVHEVKFFSVPIEQFQAINGHELTPYAELVTGKAFKGGIFVVPAKT
jgi:hypothetical protein